MKLAQAQIDRAIANKGKAEDGVKKAQLKVKEAENGVADVCVNINAQARSLEKRAFDLRKLTEKL